MLTRSEERGEEKGGGGEEEKRGGGEEEKRGRGRRRKGGGGGERDKVCAKRKGGVAERGLEKPQMDTQPICCPCAAYPSNVHSSPVVMM